jgi:cytochrome c553
VKRGALRRLGSVVGIAAVLAAFGLAAAASGVLPVHASSGHWSTTAWFLDFAKRRSVSTHTLFTKIPELKEPGLIVKGAGHYHLGCRPCHGSPELKSPRIAAAMTPPPPYLPPRIERWKPEELAYIVKHGIKFTGMPAWPAQQRDDEVHAVVAFLLELPKLDAAAYRRLIDGDADAAGSSVPLPELSEPLRVPSVVTANCAACHGRHGRGRGTGAFPNLAGQRPEYLLGALRAYARGERYSGIMQPIAAGLSDTEWREIADYYAQLPIGPTPQVSSVPATGARERGRKIAEHGIPGSGIPSCVECHGPGQHRRNPAYPILSGQYAEFLVLQLELFREHRRGGSPYAQIMHHVASRLSAQQARDVAVFYSSAGL